MEDSKGTASYYDKMDGLARWVGTSVAAAVFASLERCSCVNLNTSDTDDEDGEEAKDRPLMLAAFNNSVNSNSSFSEASNNVVNSNNYPSAVEKLPV